jgi:hypothetical protein
VIQDPALFVSAVIVAVYAALCLACWALNIKGARVAPVLAVALLAGAATGYFLLYAVRW